MKKSLRISLLAILILIVGGLTALVVTGEGLQGMMKRLNLDPSIIRRVTSSCTETDQGINYFLQGTATGLDEKTKVNGTYADSCSSAVGMEGLNEGEWIAEKHCSTKGNYVHTQWYKCPNGCSNGKCIPLKSAFLKDNETAQNILNGEDYDMEELGLRVGLADGDKDTFAYRIVSALQMLGYNTDAGSERSGNKPQVVLLNIFQRNHSFPETNLLSKEVLTAIDSELIEKEQIDSSWTNRATLTPFQDRHENEYPKDHSTMLFNLAYSVLPSYLQSDTEELKTCNQCAHDYDNGSNTFIDPYVSNDSDVWGLPPSGFSTIKTTLHEYAHQLDGVVKRPDPALPHKGIIDTRTFYDISYVGVSDVENWPFEYGDNCFARRTNDNYEFISRYAADSQGVNHPEDCPADYYTVAEDFAESFAAYVASGKDFRAAAAIHPVIRQKYNWLKDHVFEGREYNTDFAWGNASGCTDIPGGMTGTYPGYLKCNPSYVWDGELENL